MKRNGCLKISRLLQTFFACFIATCAWADTEVNVEKAGTLSTLLTTSDATLKVRGSINGTDLKLIREWVGKGTVTALDLSGVNIVSGGVAYYNSFKTEDNVIGESLFQDCVKLKNILLPANIKIIKACAFSGTGITKVDIPNTVTSLGVDM